MLPSEQSSLPLKKITPVVHTEKAESLATMATGMAHDLNNLLAAVIGNATIIRREIPAESPVQKNAHHIITSANRTLELTNQLQAYVGRGEFKLGKLDVNALITELNPAFREATHQGISIQFTPGQDIPLVLADRARITQVLSNIIRNAAEAIPESQGSITISTGTLHTDCIPHDDACLDEIPQTGDYVYIETRDTGCGMTPGTISRMFDPFFTTKIRSHGLGLSVVQGIIRAHGGGISVDSEPLKGSTITVLLPACR